MILTNKRTSRRVIYINVLLISRVRIINNSSFNINFYHRLRGCLVRLLLAFRDKTINVRFINFVTLGLGVMIITRGLFRPRGQFLDLVNFSNGSRLKGLTSRADQQCGRSLTMLFRCIFISAKTIMRSISPYCKSRLTRVLMTFYIFYRRGRIVTQYIDCLFLTILNICCLRVLILIVRNTAHTMNLAACSELRSFTLNNFSYVLRFNCTLYINAFLFYLDRFHFRNFRLTLEAFIRFFTCVSGLLCSMRTTIINGNCKVRSQLLTFFCGTISFQRSIRGQRLHISI